MSGVRFEEVEGGAVALREDAEAARLTAELRDDLYPGAWITAAGEQALFPDLYALAGDRWVRAGYDAHQVVVPAGDSAQLELWYGLCFGRQQVYAEQPVAPPASDDSSRAIAVRPGTIDDALAFGDLIGVFQTGPPVWSVARPWSEDELREAWAEAIGEPGSAYLVAELDGQRAAYALLRRVDEEEANLAVMGTDPGLRGRGVGRALFAAAMRWAFEAGFRRLSADWRSTNLPASRFWTSRGFVPVRYRLHRLVGR